MHKYQYLYQLPKNDKFQAIFNHHDFFIRVLIDYIFKNDIEFIDKICNSFHEFYIATYGEELIKSECPCLADCINEWLYSKTEYFSYENTLKIEIFITLQSIYHFINEFETLEKIPAIHKFSYLANLIIECIAGITDIESREDEALIQQGTQEEKIDDFKKEILSDLGRLGGKSKRSPYEKTGTIQAVYEVFNEQKYLLKERGGKAKLCQIAIDLINENKIPAPTTPTLKTVETWLKKFQNEKLTS